MSIYILDQRKTQVTGKLNILVVTLQYCTLETLGKMVEENLEYLHPLPSIWYFSYPISTSLKQSEYSSFLLEPKKKIGASTAFIGFKTHNYGKLTKT